MSINIFLNARIWKYHLNQTQFKVHTYEEFDRIFIVRTFYPNFRQTSITSSWEDVFYAIFNHSVLNLYTSEESRISFYKMRRAWGQELIVMHTMDWGCSIRKEKKGKQWRDGVDERFCPLKNLFVLNHKMKSVVI